MDRKRIFAVLLAVSLALMLLTVYLAMFYAPLPAMSVKTADGLLTSLEGEDITVAGFAWNVTARMLPSIPEAPPPQLFTLLLFDFSDFERYSNAAQAGELDQPWWNVQPLLVHIKAGGQVGGYVTDPIMNGTNLSVTAKIWAPGAYLDENPDQYLLVARGAGSVEVAESSSAFSLVTAPVAQKIFYFHMPSAWVSYLGFFVTLVFSAMYLKSRKPKFDVIAYSAAELGVLFATLALLSGPIWAKEEWGVYWRWNDTKLVTTFILWLVYIGYLMLRAAITEPTTRARVSAVYGILGFVTVPMSLLSSRIAPLLQSGHPVVIATKGGSLSPEAGMTIGFAVIAFTFLFITMLIKRVEVAECEENVEELKRSIGGEE